MSDRYKSFSEFWPFYLVEHSHSGTRLLHLIGTVTGVGLMVLVVAIGRWYLFPLALVPGYAGAWLGHFHRKEQTGNLRVSVMVAHGRSQNDRADAHWQI